MSEMLFFLCLQVSEDWGIFFTRPVEAELLTFLRLDAE